MDQNLSANEESNIALKVAHIVYGSVLSDTPQWNKCLEVVRSLKSDMTIAFVGLNRDRWMGAQKAFDICNTFNKQFPVGTTGAITVGHVKVSSVVEASAIVYPNPAGGETVMAWFRGVGWRDIKDWGPEPRVVSLSEELVGLGHQARTAGKPDMALALFESALIVDPNYWQAHNEKGVLLAAKHDYKSAVDCYDMALLQNPKSGEALNNRSLTLRALGRTDEALSDARRALELVPGNETMALNVGAALDDIGNTDEAVKILDAHLDRHPNDPNSRYNKSLTLLSAGHLARGWDHFDARFAQPSCNTHYEHYDIPRWRGQNLKGSRVLIWTEQGLGDEVMTASMIQDVIDQAPDVTIICSHRLVPVFTRSFPTAKVGERPSLTILDSFRREQIHAEHLDPIMLNKTFDYQISQGDMGSMFRRKFSDFPKATAFLKANSNTAKAYREHFKSLDGNRLVGISWNSHRNPRIGKLKGVDLKALAPILKVPGCTFVNLQYGDCEAEIAEVEKEFGIKIVSAGGCDPLKDMNLFFSVVAAMDLVITMSNTTAHVAGSLGVPTWVMTPTGPGKLWYWHRDREDSPWYPSVRLFRQPHAMEWNSVIDRVVTELKGL